METRVAKVAVTFLVAALALTLGALAIDVAPAHAAGTVTDCSKYGPGPGTLQEALAGGGTVTFACNGTIVVPEIVIIQDTVLDGTTHNVTLSGNNANRVLRVAGSADLTVKNLTIANGKVLKAAIVDFQYGGGIQVTGSGDLTIERSVIRNNLADNGGGISYASTGALTIRDSTIRDNTCKGGGGGLRYDAQTTPSAQVTITGSTFTGNGDVNCQFGGAIDLDFNHVGANVATVDISNSTISNNEAGSGDGIFVAAGNLDPATTPILNLTHVTFAGNVTRQDVGGLVFVFGQDIFYQQPYTASSTLARINLYNTIVEGGCKVSVSPHADAIFSQTFVSHGYNLSGKDVKCNLNQGTDQQNVDPQLAALADNGGPTQTRALNAGSPAINMIPLVNGSCNDTGVTTDQRGYARPEPSGTLCDIGAYEADAQPPADAGLTIVKETIGGGGSFEFTSTSLTPSPFTLTAGQTGTFSGAHNIIGSNRYYNCALQTDGNVLCWGNAPTPIPAGPFVEVSVGWDHVCGLRPDGSVDCWGDADPNYGQAADRPGPYTQVVAGDYHTCALTPAGAAECWGKNDDGQAQGRPGPYVYLASGYQVNCGLTPSGSMECWGGSSQTSAGPYTQISVGSYICGLKPDGDIECPYGTQSQLYTGPFVDVSVGDQVVGLYANGSLGIWGWGADALAMVAPSGPFVDLGQAQYRTYCALDAQGAADCFGGNDGGHAVDRPGPFGSPSQKTFSNLVPGTYDVTEQIPAGWTLSDLSCDGGNPQVNGATVSVTLAQSEQVTCTYEDTPAGTIVITKQTAPADNAGTQQFGFTDNINAPNSFTLAHGEARVFSDVPAGTYEVTETSIAPDYTLANLTCVETGGQANSTGNLATRKATIHLEAGETVRCTYTNALDDVIIVEKVTNPANPNYSFDFTLSDGVNPDSTFTLSDGEQAVYTVGQGTFTITEELPLFHTLTAIECAVVDSNGNETPVSGDLNTGSAALTLTGGEIGFCRFTNTEQASLTVVKEAFPPDGTNFQFMVYDTFNSEIDAFGLQDTDDITNPEHLVGGGLLEPGFYTINELVGNVPDWANVNVACELDDGTPKSFANGSYGEIVVDLKPGEDVACTFTNVLMGKINITKQATPDDGTEFVFGGDLGTFTLTHGLMAEYIVPFGAYDVDELPPLGWQLDDVQCVVDSGSTSTFDYNIVPDGVRIDLGPGEEVTCTFNNSEIPRGTINVVKDATPADNTPFGFANTIDNVPFTLNDPLTTTQTFTDVLPGLYRVIELQDAGQWELTGITCVESVDQNSQVSVPFRAAEIQVDPGETVTCTFSNQEVLTGTINILKIADPADGTPFGFSSDIPGSTSFSLADDGVSDAYFKTIPNVPAGSYVVTETVTAGWALVDVVCYDDNRDSVGDPANHRAQIELQGNEEVTCFFANAQPSIEMTKTVGIDPNVCATTDSITVVPGTDVYYCYTVTNTGAVALPLHDLVDDQLGTLLDDFAFDLAPGATVSTVDAGAVISITATTDVTNTAVWTAFVDPNITASYTDTATVNVVNPSITMAKTVGTDPAVCAATDSITVAAGTDVYYCYTVTNNGDVALPLHDLVDDQLGTLLDDFAFDLAPGATVSTVDAGATISATVTTTVTNEAVWTAFVDPNITASFTDTATVNVLEEPQPYRIYLPLVFNSYTP